MTTIALRPYIVTDLPTLASIARAAIEEIAVEDYSEAQCAAWAEALEDDLATRVEKALTLVATVDAVPVGFAALVDNGHIDLLYVDPRVARSGVATTLLDALEKLATARGAKELTADASDTAKPLFDARSFVAFRRNTITLGDEWLANTSMKKTLGPKQ